MIQVEKKFVVSRHQEAELIKGAQFIGEYSFSDIYYDTAEYALGKNDIWLRRCKDQWQVKIPMSSASGQYQDIKGEENIRQIFDVAPKNDFEKDIAEFGYAPFCKCKTIRKKFSKEKFIINLDEIEFFDAFGKTEYSDRMCEIEIAVPSIDDIAAASDAILEFAKKVKLQEISLRAKVLNYLKNKKPEHYQALIETHIIE